MLQEKIKKIIEQINSELLERDNIVKNIFKCILIKEHAVLIGVPGVAKSLAIRNIVERISDCKYFETLMRKDTPTDDLFGAVIIEDIKHGIVNYNTEDTLADCHIAFLDELFRGNSTALNATLTLINERIFHNGKQKVNSPLISMFAASNSFPDTEDLQAFKDRFLVTLIVEKIKDNSNFKKLLELKLYKNTNKELKETITIAELIKAQQEVEQIKISDTVLNELVELRDVLSQHTIKPSDRKFTQTLKYLQATAYIKGRDQVMLEDFQSLIDVLWIKQEDIEIVKTILEKYQSEEKALLKEFSNTLDEIQNKYVAGKATEELYDILGCLKYVKCKIVDVETMYGSNTEVINACKILKERTKDIAMPFIKELKKAAEVVS